MTTTTFFIIFIPILAILLLSINLLLAPHNPYQEKDSTFECGFHSFLGQNRTQFSISFFIFALLFLLFDLEILLVYPYSVSGYNCDIYGLVIMMIFFILLTLGFIFELGKNALSIDSKQTVSYGNEQEQNPLSFIYIEKFLFENFNNQISVLHSGFFGFKLFKGPFLYYVLKPLLFVINNKDVILLTYLLSSLVCYLLSLLLTNIDNITICFEFLKGYNNLIEQEQYMCAEQDYTYLPKNDVGSGPNNEGLYSLNARRYIDPTGGNDTNGTSNTNGTYTPNGIHSPNETSNNNVCPDRGGQPHPWVRDTAPISNNIRCYNGDPHNAYNGPGTCYHYCPVCAAYSCNNCR